jgi:molecular chaperone IbpA
MNQLARFDTTALNRALIGFDRIFNDFENRSHQSSTNYPPYNVIKYNENSFEIQLAVAGFSKEEIIIEVDQDQLTIKGYSQKNPDEVQYLHRGLAARDFSRSFTLAEHVMVHEVELTNGILCVKLTREVPEALKPRIIAIK